MVIDKMFWKLWSPFFAVFVLVLINFVHKNLFYAHYRGSLPNKYNKYMVLKREQT